jgi:hypothetical protein
MATSIFPEPMARSAVPGVSPGRGLLIPLGYLHPGKFEHSEAQSHPPCHGCANVRVITDLKNMADYHEEQTLKASEKAKNEDKNDCHKTKKRLLRRDKCWKKDRKAQRNVRLWIETQSKFVDILFALR